MMPTGRQMVMAWVVALVLAGVVCGLGLRAGVQELARASAGLRTVFIGSSLMQHAVSNGGASAVSAIAGLAPMRRLAVSNAGEAQLLRVAEAAVSEGVDWIFIEANPLVTQFSSHEGGCGVAYTLTDWVWLIRTAIKPVFRPASLTRDARQLAPDPRWSARSAVAVKGLYPLRFDDLCDPARWQALAQAARGGGLQIVLVAMPRSGFARQIIGAGDMARFHRAARQMANRFGWRFFDPDAADNWPDAAFVDQAHLSAAGVQAFAMALSQWWRGAQ